MQDTKLQVSGMSCNSCVARVTRALDQIEGVREVEVELRSGTVRIRHAPGLAAAKLAERLSEAGYPSRVA